MITDLPEEIASRTTQPPFEAVVTRVRDDRQRIVRRTAVSGALLAVTALLVVPHLGSDSADEEPSNPGPSDTVPTTGLALGVEEVMARPHVSVAQISGADDGGVAALWEGCEEGQDCGYVVLTRNGRSPVGSVVADSPVLSPTAAGWLIHTEGGWRLLTSDGGVSGVTIAGLDGVRAGDQVVQTQAGAGLLRGDRLLLMPTQGDNVSSSYVTPDGRLLQSTFSPTGTVHLAATRDGQHWSTARTWGPTPGLRVLLTGRGHTVAAVVLTVQPNGHTALRQVDVSQDKGRTWTTAHGIDFANEVRDYSGVAVSVRGTVYLTTGSDGLIRIDAQGNAMRTPIYTRDRAVFTTTYDVCVLTQPRRTREPEVVSCSEDDGTAWSDQPVPGQSLVSAR